MKHLAATAALTALASFPAAAERVSDLFTVRAAELPRLGVVLGRPTPVDTVTVATAPAEVVVPPASEALVSAPVAGSVARILAAAGEPVRSGQALAELESPDFLGWQRELIEAAVDDDLAQVQLERDRGLEADGIIAGRRLAETSARARAARVRLDQARQQLRMAGLGEADIDRLAATGTLLPRLVLRAPFDGVVLEQYAHVGARIESLDALMRIADLETLWLEIHLRPDIAAGVRPGMTAAVSVGGLALAGAVTTVGRVVDPTTQTVLVRAPVSNTGSRLVAGQFLPARIVAASELATFALPAAAVTRSGNDVIVFARTHDGFAARRVELASEDNERVYVKTGIDAATEIAVEGISALKSLWLADATEGS